MVNTTTNWETALKVTEQTNFNWEETHEEVRKIKKYREYQMKLSRLYNEQMRKHTAEEHEGIKFLIWEFTQYSLNNWVE